MIDTEDYVLLVEDNPDDVELTILSFEKNKLSYKIVVARDGAEALDYLFGTGPYSQKGRDRPPALILLDLGLPKVHGLEVLRQLRADRLFTHLPIIILTNSYEEKDRSRAKILGADMYIRKPVDFDDFTEVIQQIRKLLAARDTSV